MLKLLAKIFGDKSQKDIKLMMPLVEATKREGETLLSISNDELRAINSRNPATRLTINLNPLTTR
jgi:preprotein translocase subunit SecA